MTTRPPHHTTIMRTRTHPSNKHLPTNHRTPSKPKLRSHHPTTPPYHRSTPTSIANAHSVPSRSALNGVEFPKPRVDARHRTTPFPPLVHSTPSPHWHPPSPTPKLPFRHALATTRAPFIPTVGSSTLTIKGTVFVDQGYPTPKPLIFRHVRKPTTQV